MIKKFFSKIFKKKTIIQAMDEDKAIRAEQYKIHLQYLNAEKDAWEKKNELAKKFDACNLGCTHTAFDGTYEQYQAWINKLSCNSLLKFSSTTSQQFTAGATTMAWLE